MSSSGWDLAVVAEPTNQCLVQTSTNLVNWADWTNFVPATLTPELIDTQSADVPRRFYRATTW